MADKYFICDSWDKLCLERAQSNSFCKGTVLLRHMDSQLVMYYKEQLKFWCSFKHKKCLLVDYKPERKED